MLVWSALRQSLAFFPKWPSYQTSDTSLSNFAILSPIVFLAHTAFGAKACSYGLIRPCLSQLNSESRLDILKSWSTAAPPSLLSNVLLLIYTARLQASVRVMNQTFSIRQAGIRCFVISASVVGVLNFFLLFLFPAEISCCMLKSAESHRVGILPAARTTLPSRTDKPGDLGRIPRIQNRLSGWNTRSRRTILASISCRQQSHGDTAATALADMIFSGRSHSLTSPFVTSLCT
ncbi:hypothetical protein BR93DRAFT_9374 [Coniochaeta sp. PMI_546]|nr:hypothetical protein BR93DRAFT_9374 [Coniochaeta sp. PMI_546]